MLRIFSRKWLLTTLLVIAAVGVMARLGVWQLDRLEQRRAFNARVLAQINQPPLDLAGQALSADLVNMEYRKVVVRGEYDHSQEVALRNQAMGGRWGYHLITPLVIEGSDQAVLVDRGWVPAEGYTPGDPRAYAEPGPVEVHGVIRRAQTRPDIGRRTDPTPASGEGPLQAWNLVNVQRIDEQTSHLLLPVYVQQAPLPGQGGDSDAGLPVRTEPKLEITEGSHMGYALQWFGFAALLGIGYPFYVKKEEARQVNIARSIPF